MPSPRVGFLTACVAAVRSLSSTQHEIGLMLLQQRMQRFQPEMQVNASFAHALSDAEQQGTAEQQDFRAIEEQVLALEKSLAEERKRQVPEYMQALEAAKNETLAVQLRNADIKIEIEGVNQNNEQLRKKALTLKQESWALATEVNALRGNLSGTVDLATAALKGIELDLDSQASNFQKLESAAASRNSKMALLGLSTSQPQMHARSSDPLEQASSLQALLSGIVQRNSNQAAALHAAFTKEIEATSAKRSEYLNTQIQLKNTLADVKATSVKLSNAVRHFEETKQKLISLYALFQEHLPEFAEELAPATEGVLEKPVEYQYDAFTMDSAPVEHVARDEAAPAAKPAVQEQVLVEATPATDTSNQAIEEAATVLTDAVTEPAATTANATITPTYWAELAFQIKGSQDDYDAVMAADLPDREATYDLIMNGQTHQDHGAEQVSRGEATPAVKPAVQEEVVAEAAPATEKSQQAVEEPKQSDLLVKKHQDHAVEESALSDTHWAEEAYQLSGKQEDYELVMSVPHEEREEMYSRIKSGPCLVSQGTTDDGNTKVWMSEEAFRGRYARYGMDHLLAVLNRGLIEKRFDPNCPRQNQYFVQDEEEVLTSFPCLPPRSTTDSNYEPAWLSEDSLHQKYGADHVDALVERGFIKVRRNPDCPRRKQYFVFCKQCLEDSAAKS